MVAVQFVMSIAFSIVAPIMPLFLPDLGVVSASAALCRPAQSTCGPGCWPPPLPAWQFFTAPVWGSLADRYGRKLMVLRSTFGIAVFTFLMGIAHRPPA
jgi:MFS transporter, DHA1 family, multidrug resistance protein